MSERLAPATELLRRKVAERVRAGLLNRAAERATAEACGVTHIRVRRARAGKND